MCLKNTGGALSNYVHGQFSHYPSSLVQAVADTCSSIEILPPPLPLPNFQNPVHLQRAASVPETKQKSESKPAGVGPTIMEDGELDFEARDNEKRTRKHSSRSNRESSTNRENRHPYDHEEQGRQQPPPPQPQQPSKEEAVRGSTKHRDISSADYNFLPLETMWRSSSAEPVPVEELNRKEFEEKTKGAPLEKVPEPEPLLEAEEKVPMPALEKNGMNKGGGEMRRRSGKLVSLMHKSADYRVEKSSESAHEVSKMLEGDTCYHLERNA